MSKQFYYQIMGEQFGPLSGLELRARAVAGDVTVDTPVRVGADGEWLLAAQLHNLFDPSGRPISHAEMAQTQRQTSLSEETPAEAAPHGGTPSHLLFNSLSFAARVHHGQTRKDGETPYVAHTFRVVTVLTTVFGVHDPEVLAAAALHGAIEDTPTDLDELVAVAGKRVAQYVALLSKDNRLADEQREQAYLQQLQEADIGVKLCKLADLYDNLMDSGNLPKKSQTRTLRRAKQIAEHFAPGFPDEWRHALELVQDLIVETSGGLIH